MKRIYFIFCLIIILFNSCETDVDVNAQWEEIPVIIGLLDKSQDIQYVKVNKVFLGEASAEQMASVSDSLNYNPEDIIVSLHKIQANGDTISSILKDTILEKDDGMFAVDNNIVYYLETPIGYLEANKIYAITVENIRTGKITSSHTSLINDFMFQSWDGTGIGSTPYLVPFYNMVDGENQGGRTLRWDPNSNPNAVIYELALRFHYTEDGDSLDLLWRLPQVGNDEDNLRFGGSEFYYFLESNLEKNMSIRKFLSIDIEMTLGTQDLHTYMLVNQEITSIVQQRPPFTNVINGIGLFSSRYSRVYSGLGLKAEALDYLNSVDGLDRNFQ